MERAVSAKGRIYLDQSSTSLPKPPEVVVAVTDFLSQNGSNIGRGVYPTAVDAAAQVLIVRESLRDLFRLSEDSSHVVFTSGATAAMNMVLKGLLRPGDHLLFSAVEHNDVLRCARQLERWGITHTVVPCDSTGRMQAELLPGLAQKNTRAVVLSHASNVCGTIQPVAQTAAFCREKGLWFLLDAAQTGGCVPLDVSALGADGVILSGHKGLLGPQGVGALLLRDGLAQELEPLIAGGTGSLSHCADMPSFLPDRLEAGTLNLPGILGLGAGVRLLGADGPAEEQAHEQRLTCRFLRGLRGLPGVRSVGPGDPARQVGIVSVECLQKDPAEIAFRLSEEYGVYTRAGLHCAPLAHKALGTFPAGTVRFSFGRATDKEEIDLALEALEDALKK